MNAAAILIFIVSAFIICVLLLVIVYLATRDNDSDSSSSDDDSTSTDTDDTVYDLLNSDQSGFSDDVKSSMFPYLLYGVVSCMSDEGGIEYSSTKSTLKAYSSNYALQYTINSDDTITFVLKWKGKSQTFTYNDDAVSFLHASSYALDETAESTYNSIVEGVLLPYAKASLKTNSL